MYKARKRPACNSIVTVAKFLFYLICRGDDFRVEFSWLTRSSSYHKAASSDKDLEGTCRQACYYGTISGTQKGGNSSVQFKIQLNEFSETGCHDIMDEGKVARSPCWTSLLTEVQKIC